MHEHVVPGTSPLADDCPWTVPVSFVPMSKISPLPVNVNLAPRQIWSPNRPNLRHDGSTHTGICVTLHKMPVATLKKTKSILKGGFSKLDAFLRCEVIQVIRQTSRKANSATQHPLSRRIPPMLGPVVGSTVGSEASKEYPMPLSSVY